MLVPRDQEDSEEFRTFRKQLYHACMAVIFEPLRHGMTTPEVVQCPDGHLPGSFCGEYDGHNRRLEIFTSLDSQEHVVGEASH